MSLLTSIMPKKILVLLIVGSFFANCALAQATNSNNGASLHQVDFTANVRYYQLPNNMQIIVKVDKRAKVVVSQLWYKVGSMHEHNGITGISHLLEHMMFKGTKKLKAGEFSKLVAAAGGRDNAFTARDYTAYHQTIGSDKLSEMLRLEADRMRNLDFAAHEFTKELEVVKEERRLRTDDNPHALLYERLNATMFMNSPYHHPVIGWMEDINALTADDAYAWYKKWYHPNNAILVVVGDVKPDAVYNTAKRWFGAYKKQDLPVVKPQLETKQHGERNITVYGRTASPMVSIGFKVPSLPSASAQEIKDVYALVVLNAILDRGDYSRFERILVRQQQLAQSASSYYRFIDRLKTSFTFTAVPSKEYSLKQVEQALLAQIKELQSAKVSDGELKAAKTQILADNVYLQDSMFQQALVLGIYQAVGLSFEQANDFIPSIEAINSDDIMRVANKYFDFKRKTTAYLLPEQGGSEPIFNNLNEER